MLTIFLLVLRMFLADWVSSHACHGFWEAWDYSLLQLTNVWALRGLIVAGDRSSALRSADGSRRVEELGAGGGGGSLGLLLLS